MYAPKNRASKSQREKKKKKNMNGRKNRIIIIKKKKKKNPEKKELGPQNADFGPGLRQELGPSRLHLFGSLRQATQTTNLAENLSLCPQTAEFVSMPYTIEWYHACLATPRSYWHHCQSKPVQRLPNFDLNTLNTTYFLQDVWEPCWMLLYPVTNSLQVYVKMMRYSSCNYLNLLDSVYNH